MTLLRQVPATVGGNPNPQCPVKAGAPCPFEPVLNPNTTQDVNAFIDDYAPPPGTQISYEVQVVDLSTGKLTWAVTAPMTVTAADCSCATPVVCAPGQCGMAPNGCGGILDCGGCPNGEICRAGGTCCKPGTPGCKVPHAICHPPLTDCGGYCCKCKGPKDPNCM